MLNSRRLKSLRSALGSSASHLRKVLARALEQTVGRGPLARRIDELEQELAQIQPLLELHARLPTRHPLPPMREFSIAPDFALFLAELIAQEQPQLVVETGSGVSTLVIAYALERLGRGRVVSLELDPGYAQVTRAEIAKHGLTAYATVMDAPLEPLTVGGQEYRWHALRALDGLGPIDLVIDDGPPRYLGDMLRYASLPTFAERMSPRATFVLDVIGPEEREVLARWRDEHPEFSHEEIENKKGAVVLRRAREAADDQRRDQSERVAASGSSTTVDWRSITSVERVAGS